MKAPVIWALALGLAVSLSACGRRNEPDTAPTTVPATDTAPYTETAPTITLPPMETNIPDPSVDTQMPIYDGTEETVK